MKTYLIIFSITYLFLMFFYAVKYIKNKNTSIDANEFLFANSNIGIVFTFLGILATLFSTFTLQGMPSFFKEHGVGAWIFLGITDVCLAGMLLYFGLKIRKFTRTFKVVPKNMTEILKAQNFDKFSLFFYVLCTTIFLIPYITIQIKGASFLFQQALPIGETPLFWSIIMVSLMLIYSSFGGIRAIYITDAIQGLIILLTTWAVAYFVIKSSNGIENLFIQVSQINQDLLSLPGPKGVLNIQFLLISFILIVLMPYVQPQLTTRILLAKSDKAFLKANVAFAFFVILVILPTVFIGFRGVLIEEENFLLYILTHDTPLIFYALFIIGVMAAAMSTTDSQLMAIGTEWGSFFSKVNIIDNKNAKIYVKIIASIVAIISLILAQSNFKSLILFSINSFIGTSYLLPLVYSVSLKNGVLRKILLTLSVFCVSIFILSMMKIIPKNIFELKIEIILYIIMFFGMSICYFKSNVKV